MDNYQQLVAQEAAKAEHRRVMIAAFEKHILEHYDLPGMRAKDMAVVMFNRNMDPRILEDVAEAMRMVGVKREEPTR